MAFSPSWTRFACAAAMVFALSHGAVAQMRPTCEQNAAARAFLLEHAGQVTPEMAARAYIDLYGVEWFSRESKAVWDRMMKDGQDMPTALDAHVARYHAKKSEAEQTAIREEVQNNMRIGLETYDLIAKFEAAEVVAADYRWRMGVVLRQWGAPADPWMGRFDEIAAGYTAKGMPADDAALRAYLETFNALERERQPNEPLLKPGSPCYEEGLYVREFSTRMFAMDMQTRGKKTRMEKLTTSSYQRPYRALRATVWQKALETGE